MYGRVSKRLPASLLDNADYGAARAALNFKGVPYTTQWIEFPDLAATWKSLGIPPNTPSECRFEYSCPTVKLPDVSYVMESGNIAKALEKLQPTPSLHLDNEHPGRAQSIIDGLLYTVGPGMMYRVPGMLLDDRGAEWYNEERKKLTGGRPLTDFADKFNWEGAEAFLEKLKDLLAENADGV